jgi:hypothetical protein
VFKTPSLILCLAHGLYGITLKPEFYFYNNDIFPENVKQKKRRIVKELIRHERFASNNSFIVDEEITEAL